jgi:tRNA(Ile)-lysidine synthase TilS/MesJ
MADAKRLCVRCVLPETFPGVRFDAEGVCNHCLAAPPLAEAKARRGELREQVRASIAARRGEGAYDCVVAFSGGKDSTFTLRHLVRDHGVRCLAVLVDNGFVSEQARRNADLVTTALGVDFQVFKPASDFMKTLYVRSATQADVHTKAAIKRASSLCNSCINLINAHMLKTALQVGAPLIAGGYLGGQVPRDSAVLALDLRAQAAGREQAVTRYVEHFGPGARAYFDTHAAIQAGRDARVTILNPMLSLDVTEDEVVAAIGELGWKRVTDVGLNSSNCRLNDLGIALHHGQHGFHPYAFEMSELIRAGVMTRERALAKVGGVPALADVAPQAAQLGLDLARFAAS